MDRETLVERSRSIPNVHDLSEDVVRLRELRRLPVVDLWVAKRVGTIKDVRIDPNAGRLASLEVRPGNGLGTLRVDCARVRRVGRRAVVLAGVDDPEPLPPEDAEEESLDSGTAAGLEVLDDCGERVGFVTDVYFDRSSLTVTAYELKTPLLQRWLHGPQLIPPDRVIACSHELMIVPAEDRSSSSDRAASADAAHATWAHQTLMTRMTGETNAEDVREVGARSA